MTIQDLNEKQTEKFKFFCDLVNNNILLYSKYKVKNDLYKLNQLQTIIGAGIFYLPSNVNTLWSKYISENTIRLIIGNLTKEEKSIHKSIVRDHINSRKISGKKLFESQLNNNQQLNYTEIVKLYAEEYGVFSYVTNNENSILKKDQNNIVNDYKKCCSNNQIQLIDLSKNTQLEEIHTIIKKFKNNKNTTISDKDKSLLESLI